MSMRINKMKKEYQSILLDVDGTLLDFDQSEAQSIQKVLVRYGFEPRQEYVDLYHEINQKAWAAFERGEITKEYLLCRRFVDFFEKLGKNVDGHQAEMFYRSLLDQSAILMDGALELCQYLYGTYSLYVVTNGTSSTQYKRLASSGLDRFMKGIFVSEDAGSQKPQKEYFDYCFAHMESPDPAKMLLVGDSLHSDILGGNQAGIDTCWFNPAGAALTGEIRPVFEIRRLLDLKEWV